MSMHPGPAGPDGTSSVETMDGRPDVASVVALVRAPGVGDGIAGGMQPATTSAAARIEAIHGRFNMWAACLA